MDTSLSVLVVDDSQTIGLVLTKHLQKLGFSDIDLARDGSAALDRLRDKQYGLVLSDWEMQPMGGDEFLKALRRATIHKVPVVLITGTTSRGTAWLAGADAYLPKPFGDKDFETAIKHALAS